MVFWCPSASSHHNLQPRPGVTRHPLLQTAQSVIFSICNSNHVSTLLTSSSYPLPTSIKASEARKQRRTRQRHMTQDTCNDALLSTYRSHHARTTLTSSSSHRCRLSFRAATSKRHLFAYAECSFPTAQRLAATSCCALAVSSRLCTSRRCQRWTTMAAAASSLLKYLCVLLFPLPLPLRGMDDQGVR